MNEQSDFTQKRFDFRIEANYPFWYRKITQGASEHQEGEWQHSSTLNLSAGGAAVPTDFQGLGPGDLIEFELVIPGGPVFGIAEILRILTQSNGKAQAALTFVSVATKDRDRIAQVVLTDGLERHHGEVK